MNNIFRFIPFVLLLALCSCSNEFLDENLTSVKNPTGESEIIISPNWNESDYQFSCPNMGNAEFEIVNAPDWLQITTKSGQLNNSIATIRCKATVHPAFDKIGIYIDKIEVASGEKTFWIPVSYITEGDPKIEVENTLSINSGAYSYPVLNIINAGEGILFWNILSLPDWLEVDIERLSLSSAIIPQGGMYQLPLKVNSESLSTGNLSGTIVLTTNDKSNQEVTISVTVDVGTPTLSFYSTATIDFGRLETTKAISFSNQGNGLLIWSLEGMPEWLSTSKSSGMLTSYSSENLSFICNRALLPAGQAEVKVTLKTNDSRMPSQVLTIRARSGNLNTNVHAVEGKIADAFFDKSTDILYYVTTQPDKLIAYNTKTKTVVQELSLSKAPTCLSVSEDGTKALVGHGGLISHLDLKNNKVLNTYNVNGILSDIEFAANNWCAYTEGGSYNIQWTKIYWVDLSTGSVSAGSIVYEDCIIKKVPGKDYIIGSETELSSGLYVYDINTRTEKANISESIDFFWFVNDGENLVSASGDVFRVSAALSVSGWNSDGLSPIGQLQRPNSSNFYGFEFIDYGKSTNSLWCLVKSDYSSTIYPEVFQLDDNNYTLVKSYSYEDYYRVNNTDYQVQAKYVFANGAGDELTVIRNATSINAWSIEFIPVTK
ncbi:MAG: hypothetical protein LLF95_12255 [Bacteroidales bacterium]|nr:hypothetical protein [Bacteroidales bacterium]